ncbi:MAG: DUF4430 domain-containing protein [Acidobacteriota bacterium]
MKIHHWMILAAVSLLIGTACATTNPSASTESSDGTADLFVDWTDEFHDPGDQACDDIPISDGTTTVLDLMDEAETDCNPAITYTYSGSGDSAFLESIDGVENDQDSNGYYWVYEVNGVSPSVGFGAYVLSDGDSVAWDYVHFSSDRRQATAPRR